MIALVCLSACLMRRPAEVGGAGNVSAQAKTRQQVVASGEARFAPRSARGIRRRRLRPRFLIRLIHTRHAVFAGRRRPARQEQNHYTRNADNNNDADAENPPRDTFSTFPRARRRLCGATRTTLARAAAASDSAGARKQLTGPVSSLANLRVARD